MEVIRTNPALLSRMFASFATVERAMIDVIAERTGTDANHDLYPVLVTAVAMGAVRASMSSWHSTGEVLPLSEIFDAAFDQVGTGLKPPKATKDVARTPAIAKPVSKRIRK
jgi:K+-transporting ATPase A subunit